jgi:hypothetical protein
MSTEQARVLTGLELHKNKSLLLQIADYQVRSKYSLYLKFKFVHAGSLYSMPAWSQSDKKDAVASLAEQQHLSQKTLHCLAKTS